MQPFPVGGANHVGLVGLDNRGNTARLTFALQFVWGASATIQLSGSNQSFAVVSAGMPGLTAPNGLVNGARMSPAPLTQWVAVDGTTWIADFRQRDPATQLVVGFDTTKGIGGPMGDMYHNPPPPGPVNEVRTSSSATVPANSLVYAYSVSANSSAAAWSMQGEGLKKSDGESWVQITDKTDYPLGVIWVGNEVKKANGASPRGVAAVR